MNYRQQHSHTWMSSLKLMYSLPYIYAYKYTNDHCIQAIPLLLMRTVRMSLALNTYKKEFWIVYDRIDVTLHGNGSNFWKHPRRWWHILSLLKENVSWIIPQCCMECKCYCADSTITDSLNLLDFDQFSISELTIWMQASWWLMEGWSLPPYLLS